MRTVSRLKRARHRGARKLTDQHSPWAHAVVNIYRLAECRPEDVEGVGWLALRLFGDASIDYAPAEQVEPVRLLEEPWRILLSADLDDEGATMAIARALALWWLSRGASVAPNPRDVAALASEIAMPSALLTEEIEGLGRDVVQIAKVFVVPWGIAEDRIRELQHASGTYSRLFEAS